MRKQASDGDAVVAAAERNLNERLREHWALGEQAMVKAKQGTAVSPPRVEVFFRPKRERGK